MPEFATSNTSAGHAGAPPVPVTRQASPRDTSAPRPRQTRTQASVSSDSRGARSSDVPSARVAMARARMVWDFEPGIRAEPLSRERSTTSSMGIAVPFGVGWRFSATGH